MNNIVTKNTFDELLSMKFFREAILMFQQHYDLTNEETLSAIADNQDIVGNILLMVDRFYKYIMRILANDI